MKANVIQSESFFYFLFFQIIMSYVVSLYPFVLFFSVFFSFLFVLKSPAWEKLNITIPLKSILQGG